jgi:hypothetical protein
MWLRSRRQEGELDHLLYAESTSRGQPQKKCHPTRGEGQDWLLELDLPVEGGVVRCLPSTIRQEEHDYQWSDEQKEPKTIQEGEAIEQEEAMELVRADEHQELVVQEVAFQDDLEPQEGWGWNLPLDLAGHQEE